MDTEIKLTNPGAHVNVFEGNGQRENKIFLKLGKQDEEKHKVSANPQRFHFQAMCHMTDSLLQYDQVFQVMVYLTVDSSISAWTR